MKKKFNLYVLTGYNVVKTIFEVMHGCDRVKSVNTKNSTEMNKKQKI